MSRWPSTWVLALGLVLLVALPAASVFFLFGSKPGRLIVSTDPSDAVVLFDERPVADEEALSPFVIDGVEPGYDHLLQVRRAGYKPFAQLIRVEPGKTLEFELVHLEPVGVSSVSRIAGTGFRLTTEPEGARVYVDGAELDQRTPAQITNLAPGTYTVRVEHGQRYLPWETVVEVPEGRVLSLPTVTLSLRSATVHFRSEPPGASIVLLRGDERRHLGHTPTNADVSLEGGLWTVEMSRPGYATWRNVLQTPRGRDEFEVLATLVPGEDHGAAGARPVSTRNTSTARAVAPSPVAASGRRAAPARPTSTAPQGTGTLQLNAIPWAQVFVDGRLVGNTPQMALTLRAGPHTVTLVNPEFAIRKTITVQVRAGETVRRVERLPLE